MKKTLILCSLLLLVACKTKQLNTVDKNKASSKACKTQATVIDMSNLDGCRFLLKVKNGEKWLPLEISDPNFQFQNGQVIAFDYDEVDDYMSICMAENKGVNITCIKEISKGTDQPAACIDVPHIIKTDWIQEVIRSKKAFRITQYKYNSEFVYLFKAKSKSYLYDCRGEAVCDFEKNASNDCTNKLKNLTDEYVIWVQNQ